MGNDAPLFGANTFSIRLNLFHLFIPFFGIVRLNSLQKNRTQMLFSCGVCVFECAIRDSTNKSFKTKLNNRIQRLINAIHTSHNVFVYASKLNIYFHSIVKSLLEN